MKADMLNGPLFTIFFTCLFVLKWEQAEQQRAAAERVEEGGREVAGGVKSAGGFMCGANGDRVTRKACTEQISFVPCHL